MGPHSAGRREPESPRQGNQRQAGVGQVHRGYGKEVAQDQRTHLGRKGGHLLVRSFRLHPPP
eukprot:8885032-Heterocapsa_arctica.AAC.1